MADALAGRAAEHNRVDDDVMLRVNFWSGLAINVLKRLVAAQAHFLTLVGPRAITEKLARILIDGTALQRVVRRSLHVSSGGFSETRTLLDRVECLHCYASVSRKSFKRFLKTSTECAYLKSRHGDGGALRMPKTKT